MNNAAYENKDLHQSRLPLFPSGKQKAPFIDDQGLQWLQTAEGIRPLECLDPARFRAARRAVEDRGESASAELPNGCSWQEIATAQDRLEFLANSGKYDKTKFHRLVLMIEAGMGKTTAVQQVMYLRNCICQGQLAMGFNFSRLPPRVEYYLDNERRWLCEQFKNLHELKNVDIGHVRLLILRKIRNREFTLVIDSFDQVSRLSREEITDKAAALNEFLNRYPEVKVVCAGRPNALVDVAAELFDMGEWIFAQIKGFDKDQQIKYVGKERVDALQNMEVELLSQPRMLEAIRRLSPKELAGLRTASALHWKVLEHVVREAYKSNSSSLSISKMQRLVSAIAFQMHAEENFDGIDQDQFDEFAVRLIEQRGAALTRFFQDTDAIERAVDGLGELNELLDFAVLEDGKRRQIYFRNRTLQAFFAALWCTRYSSHDSDIEVLRNHIYVRGSYRNHFRHADFYEFWKFATEMPASVRVDSHYVRAMSALFMPLPTEGPEHADAAAMPRRSTEMIYRSWWQLMEIANQQTSQSESELMLAIRVLQQQVRAGQKAGKMKFSPCSAWPADARSHAQHVVQQYLLEFISLAQGKHGTSGQQILAAEFDREITPDVAGHGFLQVPAGEFWFGEDPAVIETQQKPFLLARYPITNELMWLFDPTHGLEEGRFDDYTDYSSDPKCPAIYVDWYTAFAASIWFGGELPDEYGWERACRGLQDVATEPATKFYGGDSQGDLAKMAYYTVNTGDVSQPIGVPTDDKLANNFGLKHMHGTVWEQTRTWYAADPKKGRQPSFVSRFRVGRGGSFSYDDDVCRSAYRDFGRPSFTNHSVGFRVSRALLP